ncbi:helix-turn-helix domain-containing protein [Streptomyces sp. NPDC005774]|uniref:helix-turn-helix domain-containing protein n=1 Tax=Streptomyces sp. NPDC005774 TaxID=3364728 RepID=UPI0036BA448C
MAALVAGWGREDVAAVFGVSLKAVDMWWVKWQAGGREQEAHRDRRTARGAGRSTCRPELPGFSPGLTVVGFL